MEQLSRGVGRIGDVAARWMPVGIDTEAERLIGLGVVGSKGPAILAQQRGAMRAADMQAHVGRVAAVEAVAVDAALKLCVLNQCTLIKRGEVALVDAHLAPHLIARLYQTVADAVVDTVSTDVDRKRTIGVPAVFISGRDGDAERVPGVLGKQPMPLVYIEVHCFLTLAVQAVPVAVRNDGVNTQCLLVCHAEVEGSYIHGYGNTEVVGIDSGLYCLLFGIADGLRASGKQ